MVCGVIHVFSGVAELSQLTIRNLSELGSKRFNVQRSS
jgi:hypothetical protein